MKNLLYYILLVFLCRNLPAQEIFGPQAVPGGGAAQTYYYQSGLQEPYWSCSGGQVISYDGSYSATVVWGTSQTTGTLTLYSNYEYVDDYTVTIWMPPVASSASSVTVSSFTANWNSGYNVYFLDVSASSTFSTFISGYNNLSCSGTSKNVTGLSSGTTYYYRLRGYLSSGQPTANSNTITVTTAQPAPSAPTGLNATNIGVTSFAANWGTVSGATSYRLDVSASSSFSTFVTGYNNLTVSSTTQNVTGLTPNVVYYFRVRAVNSSGTSSNSSTYSVTLKPESPVAYAPYNLTSSSFKASWSAVAGATGYQLDVSSTSSFSTFISGYNSKSVTSTSYNVTGLSGSTSYYYRVRAVKSSLISDNSNASLVMNQNYAQIVQVLKEGVTVTKNIDNLVVGEKTIVFQIYDGLGRPDQTVTLNGSPSQYDIVQPVVYDSLGNERFKYLPYTSNSTGIYKTNPLAAQASFYSGQANVVHDALPVSETVYDNSPLNRVLEQSAPGYAWKISKTGGVSNRTGHTTRFEYNSYNTTDVYIWVCDEVNKIPKALSANKFYPAKKLYCNRVYNENATEAPGSSYYTDEFKDFEGKVIMKRTYDGSSLLNTYYVYDHLGNLRYVLPPMVTISTDGSNNSIVTSTELSNYCYIYRYDANRRLVMKKMPGADSVLMVYDLRDRLVATQDGVQRAKSPGEWSFSKYDALNRTVLSGTIQSANTRVQMQAAVNSYTGTNLYEDRTSSATNQYYTDKSFPNSGFAKTYMQVNYYDDYDCNYDASHVADYSYVTDSDFPSNSALTRTANKPTVNKTRQLDPASSTEVWFTTVSFYDKYYRIIQTQNSGVQGGNVRITNGYNFPGWLLKSKETQTVVQGSTSLTNTVLTRNDYDHQGRLLNTYHKINSGAEKTLASLSYNEMGQLLTKKLHVTSGTGLQKTDYTYNIRGWLKKINEPDLSGGEGDFFGAELLYNEGFEALNGTAMNGAAMYNGNISGIKWKNGSSGSTQKGYGFIYDQINRLTTSKYGEGTSYTTNVNRYDENLTYDKNGNIRKLFRNGQISTGVFGNIDSLGYKYPGTGNQLWATGDIVTDVAGRGDFFDGTNGYSTKEYYYDKNGNIWLDRNKKMKTVYNYLNLPARISDTVNTTYKIEYVYTSAGEKLKQRLSTGTALLYNGNFVYTLDGTANGIAVKYILTQEGRSTNSTGTYTYEYFMKDHLGNIRINFKDSSNVAVIIQQSDYYPFGMIHQPQATTTSDNRYLFNGKELQDESLGGVNLDLYDYQTRFYDPQIGRFTTIDPAAEKMRRVSPYSYGFNNPIRFIDPDGMVPDEWKFTFNNEGQENLEKVSNKGGNITQYVQMNWEVNGETLDQGTRVYQTNNNESNVGVAIHGGPYQGSSAWYINASGKVDNIYPEAYLVGFAQAGLKSLTKSVVNSVDDAVVTGSRAFEVGPYNTLRGAETGLEAHHVGQKVSMKKFIPDYDPNTAPSILVPKVGHTQGAGILSKGTSGITNARQLIARDIFELRRVYPSVPNNSLQKLIQMNKTMYPDAFIK